MKNVQDDITMKILGVYYNWITQYGMEKITKVGTTYIIEFATGGWSENESLINEIQLFSSVSDKGGYYIFEINGLFLSPEIKQKIEELGYNTKKKFKYEWKRGYD
jgi:hypothetical protein